MSAPSALVAGPEPAPAVTDGFRDASRLPALAPAFRAAADAHDTPLYVTDLQTLDRCAAEIEAVFPRPWLRQYSLKANGLPALVRRLACRGWGHRQQVVIDAGMTELIRPALYGALHSVYPVTSRCAPGELLDTAVEGPVCESSDTLGVHQLPALRRGDLVAISGTGAYASAQGSRYNGRPRPAELFVHSGGRLELARARRQVS